ncbi:ubiquitin-like protein 7 [Mya arenaria]|uniref:ubiquitin-like protein 7 n=1 Tax=Mya arenaria TaxID=6604 RepID=UPI0022E3F083|nr:ubiquitin-like protein 7 [Mya arenaria]
MATITICDRREEGKNTRNKLPGVNLDQNVKSFKEAISVCSSSPHSYDIVYCGQCLKEDASLCSYGIHSGSTVHLLAKQEPFSDDVSDSKAPIPKEKIKHLITLLQSALKNPAYKSTVETIFSTPDQLHDVINAVPGLNANPSTLNLFMDQELVSVLAHPGNIRRLLEAHPCFGELAEVLCERVKEAGNSGNFTTPSSGSYSIDNMSDDDEDGPSTSGGGQAITANQLAAALAAAAGGSAGSPSAQSQPISNNMITQDFFQQAILQAQSTMTGQIQQMREMGITDENVARQALQATNGDLQAAIDLIFGGEFS